MSSFLQTLSDLTNISKDKLVQILIIAVGVVSVGEVFIGIICTSLGFKEGMADGHLNNVLKIVGPIFLILGLVQLIAGCVVLHMSHIQNLIESLQKTKTMYRTVSQNEDAALLNSPDNTASSEDEPEANWKPSLQLSDEESRNEPDKTQLTTSSKEKSHANEPSDAIYGKNDESEFDATK